MEVVAGAGAGAGAGGGAVVGVLQDKEEEAFCLAAQAWMLLSRCFRRSMSEFIVSGADQMATKASFKSLARS